MICFPNAQLSSTDTNSISDIDALETRIWKGTRNCAVTIPMNKSRHYLKPNTVDEVYVEILLDTVQDYETNNLIFGWNI